MISESGSVEAMLRAPGFPPFAASLEQSRVRILNLVFYCFIANEYHFNHDSVITSYVTGIRFLIIGSSIQITIQALKLNLSS